jgi:hypothetical protein
MARYYDCVAACYEREVKIVVPHVDDRCVHEQCSVLLGPVVEP